MILIVMVLAVNRHRWTIKIYKILKNIGILYSTRLHRNPLDNKFEDFVSASFLEKSLSIKDFFAFLSGSALGPEPRSRQLALVMSPVVV